MKKIVIIGAGVAGINAATKLVDNGYDGSLITIIDKGNDPINRLPEEVMTGMLGAGGWSDGKLVVSTVQGGQLAKYCGEEKAMSLMEEVVTNFTRFHPKPDEISCSDPKTEPDFIKPYFDLRMSLVWHIGSNYLHEIAKNWYSYLLDKGVNFHWEKEVVGIHFENNDVRYGDPGCGCRAAHMPYDELILSIDKLLSKKCVLSNKFIDFLRSPFVISFNLLINSLLTLIFSLIAILLIIISNDSLEIL